MTTRVAEVKFVSSKPERGINPYNARSLNTERYQNRYFVAISASRDRRG